MVTVLGIAGGRLTGHPEKMGWSSTRARKTGTLLFALCVLPMAFYQPLIGRRETFTPGIGRCGGILGLCGVNCDTRPPAFYSCEAVSRAGQYNSNPSNRIAPPGT